MNFVESWLPVVGYEKFYEVSDLGRVRSFDRTRRNGRFTRGVMLRPGPQRKGYLTVNLCDADSQRSGRVHQLVMSAFVGPTPVGLEVLHRNDIPGDNRLSNLYYGTRAENCDEAFRNGKHGLSAAPHCPCGYEFGVEPHYRDPNTGRRACAGCRATWRERHPIYA